MKKLLIQYITVGTICAILSAIGLYVVDLMEKEVQKINRCNYQKIKE